MLSSLDFPHPLGPTIVRNSPAPTSRLRPAIAWMTRPRVAKSRATSRSDRIGSTSAMIRNKHYGRRVASTPVASRADCGPTTVRWLSPGASVPAVFLAFREPRVPAHRRQCRAQQGAEPPHPVAGPHSGGEGDAEHEGRVHRGPGQRHAEERSEEHTSELQSLAYLVCRLLLEKKKKKKR